MLSITAVWDEKESWKEVLTIGRHSCEVDISIIVFQASRENCAYSDVRTAVFTTDVKPVNLWCFKYTW